MAKSSPSSIIASFIVAIIVGYLILGVIVYFGKKDPSATERGNASTMSMDFARVAGNETSALVNDAVHGSGAIIGDIVADIHEVARDTGELAVSAYHNAADFVSYPFAHTS